MNSDYSQNLNGDQRRAPRHPHMDLHSQRNSNGFVSSTPDFHDQADIGVHEILSDNQINSARKRNDVEHYLYPTAEFRDEREESQGMTAENSETGELLPSCSFEVALRRVDECFPDRPGEAQFEHVKVTDLISQAGRDKENIAEALNLPDGGDTPASPTTVRQCTLPRQSADEGGPQPFTEVFSWGNDKHGQLGLGEKHASGKQLYMIPKRCSFNIAIAQIACGQSHSVFLTPGHLVYSMGTNQHGQLGIGDPQVRVKYSPVLIEVLVGKKPLSVACGERHTLMLCEGRSRETQQPHGEVYAWGSNQYGQTGGGGSAISSCDVAYSPRLVDFEAYNRPSIVKIDCGGQHSAMIDDMGRLFQCGRNRSGELGLGNFQVQAAPRHVEEIHDSVASVACGSRHTVAATSRGKVWVMGSNVEGQLGIGERYDDQCNPVFLKELNFAHVTKIRAGGFNAALSSENQLYVWGRGKFGDFFTPHRVKFFENYTIKDFQISGAGSAYVLTKSGDLYSWGDNRFSQLGLNDFDSRAKPSRVSALDGSRVSQVAVGETFAIALGQTLEAPWATLKTPQLHSLEGIGKDSSVILRQDSASLFSIDTYPNKMVRPSSSGTASKKAKVKSRSKGRLRDQLFIGSDGAQSPQQNVTSNTSIHSRQSRGSRGAVQRSNAAPRFEKIKSFNNLQSGIKSLAKSSKLKSKSSQKLTCVPAAPFVRQRQTDLRTSPGLESLPLDTQEDFLQMVNKYHVPEHQTFPLKHENSIRPEIEFRQARQSKMSITNHYEPIDQHLEQLASDSYREQRNYEEEKNSMILVQQVHDRISEAWKQQELEEEEELLHEEANKEIHPVQEKQCLSEYGRKKQQEGILITDQREPCQNSQMETFDRILRPASQFTDLNDACDTNNSQFHGGLPGAINTFDERDNLQRDQSGFTGYILKQSAMLSPSNLLQRPESGHKSQQDVLAIEALSQRQAGIFAVQNTQAMESVIGTNPASRKNADNPTLLTTMSPGMEQLASGGLGSRAEINLFNQNFRQSSRLTQIEPEAEVQRLSQLVHDLEERLGQQRGVKDNLRAKITSMESICAEVTGKKNKAQAEKEKATNEVVQYREDVDFLTKETTMVLDELQSEQTARRAAEGQLKSLQADHSQFKKQSLYEVEEKERQLELAKYNEEKLKEESQQWRAIADGIKAEKQDLTKRLTTEREEYRAAFQELETLKTSQSVRLEQSQREIELLSKHLAASERELKCTHDSVERLRCLKLEQGDSLQSIQRSESALKLQVEQQSELISRLRSEQEDKDHKITLLYEENLTLQRRVDAEVIHKASEYAQSQMQVLSNAGGSRVSSQYYKRSASKDKPVSFSAQPGEDSILVQPYRGHYASYGAPYAVAPQERSSERQTNPAPQMWIGSGRTEPRQGPPSGQQEVRQLQQSPPRILDTEEDTRMNQRKAQEALKQSEQRIAALLAEQQSTTQLGSSLEERKEEMLPQFQDPESQRKEFNNTEQYARARPATADQQYMVMAHPSAVIPFTSHVPSPIHRVKTSSALDLPQNRTNTMESRGTSPVRSARFLVQNSAQLSQPQAKSMKSFRSNAKTPDIDTLLRQRYEREKSRKSIQAASPKPEEPCHSKLSSITTILDFKKQNTQSPSPLRQTSNNARGSQGGSQNKLDFEQNNAVKASLADLKQRLNNMRAQRGKDGSDTYTKPMLNSLYSQDDGLDSSTQGLLGMLKRGNRE